jgi:hypothetical protein
LNSYANGEDKVYQLQISENGTYKFDLDPVSGFWGGIALFDDCPDVGSCLQTLSGSNSLEHKIIVQYLDPGVYYYMVSSNSGCLPSYHLTIEESCPLVTGLTSKLLSASSASFTWKNDGTSIWEWVLGPEGSDPSAYTPSETSDNIVIVDDLEANSSYEFFVRSTCAAGEGVWKSIQLSNIPCTQFIEGPIFAFDSIFGGAPTADPTTGLCLFNEITYKQVRASEIYSIDQFMEGETYTFSMCNGDYGAWRPELTVWNDQGELVNIVRDTCSVSWNATYSGTYLIGVNDRDACGTSSPNIYTNNGYPGLTCKGNKVSSESRFTIYPNPNSGNFNLVNMGTEGRFRLELVDMAGMTVFKEEISLESYQRTTVIMQNIRAGVYVLRVINLQDDSTSTERMVIY